MPQGGEATENTACSRALQLKCSALDRPYGRRRLALQRAKVQDTSFAVVVLIRQGELYMLPATCMFKKGFKKLVE